MLSCILFHFYIKPQHIVRITLNYSSCILFHFYIKPQPALSMLPYLSVVSYSISTSNHNLTTSITTATSVVSYSISTSNHNPDDDPEKVCNVVSYSISTSNHNEQAIVGINKELYLIPFLHQTTTLQTEAISGSTLYLIPFLHQTTTIFRMRCKRRCCILFHFYIKPQLPRR